MIKNIIHAKIYVMKKKILLPGFFALALMTGLVFNCKKDNGDNPPDECPPSSGTPTDIGIRASFTEEFEKVYELSARGWVIKDNSPSGNSGIGAQWSQGYMGTGKGGPWYGFSAYSYSRSQDEFAYSPVHTSSTNRGTISSWLITPVLSVKNGDKISFYSRSDTTGNYTERMQVLMNKSSADYVGERSGSVCSFTTVLLDINSGQTAGGYPINWTKYEYTFTGITGRIDTRIAFRHYVVNTSDAKGIGIDLFKFEVN